MRLSNKLFLNKIFKDNKGLELSINFIVVLIFSILILSMGIFLFTQIFEEGGDLTKQFSEQTQKEINSLLEDKKDLIALPNVVSTLKKGETAHFPIGIKGDTERCGETKSADFNLKLELVQIEENNDVRLPTNDERALSNNWYFDYDEFTINNNEKWSDDIPIRAGDGAVEGNTYVFDVDITCNNQLYDDYTHLLFLVVE